MNAFVYPTSILTELYAKEIRKDIVHKNKLVQLAVFGQERVFSNVSRKICILILEPKGKHTESQVDYFEEGIIIKETRIRPLLWLHNHNYMFDINTSNISIALKNKVTKQSIKVGNVYYVNYGAQICSKEKGAFSQEALLGNKAIGNAKKCLRGTDIKRYALKWNNYYLNYQPKIMYGPRHPYFFESPKIIINKTSSKGFGLMATYDINKFYSDQRSICLVRYHFLEGTNLKMDFPGYEKSKCTESEVFHLALLNSKLIKFYFANFIATKNLQGDYTDVLPKMVRDLPLLLIDFSSQLENSKYIRLTLLANSMLEMHVQYISSNSEMQKNTISKQIEAIDKEIDGLVFELYGLTDEEIKIIEDGVAK
ncbi:MAG: hypothetical protein KJ808_06360 [Acidobacteria bacterium]|nr:hypothetical protein [Acidobacteriota bacterium]MBU4306441.1 hypothetical protein [Acidobacteriota bacterium]MCG2811561.1 hypothetical protein [Candidatus Aminicenantes bacterium]